MNTYRPRITHLTPKQVAPFSNIINTVWTPERGRRAASEILGVSEGTIRSIRERAHLTDKQARVILGNYKKWKATP